MSSPRNRLEKSIGNLGLFRPGISGIPLEIIPCFGEYGKVFPSLMDQGQ
ncbi:MAG: hypothetical protein H3C63_13695 [Candidatus Omnitrophica bacterium]|nr:hypothetical protein [Candidatus Omnitrophota bacterium]MCK6496251.1 hypothetical protein [bacterium]NUP93566.1 hypothetical protein [Candidatus Omnitrophota bacterium]